MGTENKNEYTVYWGGVPLGNTPIAPGIIHEVTLSEDALTPEAGSHEPVRTDGVYHAHQNTEALALSGAEAVY